MFQGTRPKRMLKVQRLDTEKKIGCTARTLSGIWSEISVKWPDIIPENYLLTEEDETEITTNEYYEALENNTLLQLHLKSTQEGIISLNYSIFLKTKIFFFKKYEMILHRIACSNIVQTGSSIRSDDFI